MKSELLILLIVVAVIYLLRFKTGELNLSFVIYFIEKFMCGQIMRKKLHPEMV